MRTLAKKWGFYWIIITIIPLAAIFIYIGKHTGLSEAVRVGVGSSLLAVQLFGLFMSVRYHKEVFGF